MLVTIGRPTPSVTTADPPHTHTPPPPPPHPLVRVLCDEPVVVKRILMFLDAHAVPRSRRARRKAVVKAETRVRRRRDDYQRSLDHHIRGRGLQLVGVLARVAAPTARELLGPSSWIWSWWWFGRMAMARESKQPTGYKRAVLRTHLDAWVGDQARRVPHRVLPRAREFGLPGPISTCATMFGDNLTMVRPRHAYATAAYLACQMHAMARSRSTTQTASRVERAAGEDRRARCQRRLRDAQRARAEVNHAVTTAVIIRDESRAVEDTLATHRRACGRLREGLIAYDRLMATMGGDGGFDATRVEPTTHTVWWAELLGRFQLRIQGDHLRSGAEMRRDFVFGKVSEDALLIRVAVPPCATAHPIDTTSHYARLCGASAGSTEYDNIEHRPTEFQARVCATRIATTMLQTRRDRIAKSTPHRRRDTCVVLSTANDVTRARAARVTVAIGTLRAHAETAAAACEPVARLFQNSTSGSVGRFEPPQPPSWAPRARREWEDDPEKRYVLNRARDPQVFMDSGGRVHTGTAGTAGTAHPHEFAAPMCRHIAESRRHLYPNGWNPFDELQQIHVSATYALSVVERDADRRHRRASHTLEESLVRIASTAASDLAPDEPDESANAENADLVSTLDYTGRLVRETARDVAHVRRLRRIRRLESAAAAAPASAAHD